MSTRVSIISDIHVASIFGLFPIKFVDSHGHEIFQNPGQKYTWSCWLDYVERTKKFKPDAIIVNGDVVDGKQRMQEAEELILNLPFDQEEAALEVLRPLKEAAPKAKWFFVAGTEYHDNRSARSIENIASRMDAVKYPGVGSGRFCREVLDLELEGVTLNIAHHIGGGGGMTRSPAIEREMVLATLAGRDGKGPRADVIIRSHIHNFVHVEDPTKHGFTTPCWELQTRFMRKRSVFKMLPDIGGLLLEIDGEAKKRGEDPCQLTKVLYRLPEVKPYRLTT